jgi:hypothetical protein
MRHLNGDMALKLIVVGQVDQPKPAFSQESLNAVTPDVRWVIRLLRRGFF